MARMTEKREIKTSLKFYDEIAVDYDMMTGYEQRFKHELRWFRVLVKRYGLKTALDAGCGTGFHSILLSKLGLQVTACDISKEMLKITRSHAREYGFRVETLHSSLSGLKDSIPKNKYDSIFCLGNTFAHILTKDELEKSLRSFHVVLKPKGILFLQILNYTRILNTQERIQNMKEVNNKMYIRFYDYKRERIVFNVLTIERHKSGLSYSLSSLKHRPWKEVDIIRMLRRSGFQEVNTFGSIELDVFKPESSKDLVVLAVA